MSPLVSGHQTQTLPNSRSFKTTRRYAVFATSEFDGGFLDSFAVYAEATGTGGIGVFGSAPVSGFAGYFLGNVFVQGTLSKSAGSFKIDHPLDPENKYLSHSFVESPDMMNVYNGNLVTDTDGYSTVVLPEWFEVLNREFRYQLTVIDDENSDDFVHAKVVQRIKDNRFRIRTSTLTQLSRGSSLACVRTRMPRPTAFRSSK